MGHDDKLSGLVEECRRYHQAVKLDERFRDLYIETTSEASLAPLRLTLADLFGAYPEEFYRDNLAELIVNNTGDLPSHYTSAPYWNKYKNQFLAIRQRPGVEPHYAVTTKAGHALRQQVEQMIALLKDTRLGLSSLYGEPFVTARRGLAGGPGSAY